MPTKAPPQVRTVDGELIDVPADGMLGLLALGADGVRAWRQAREAAGLGSAWTIQAPSEEEQKEPIQNFHTQGIIDGE
jgi:hypothetical protein